MTPEQQKAEISEIAGFVADALAEKDARLELMNGQIHELEHAGWRKDAEIARLELELDLVYSQRNGLTTALKVARKAIENAPHVPMCDTNKFRSTFEPLPDDWPSDWHPDRFMPLETRIPLGLPCNCWKRDALAAIDAACAIPTAKDSLTVHPDMVCTLCHGPADYTIEDGFSTWRHKGDPFTKEFGNQQFCDKYGYPIKVITAKEAEEIRQNQK